METTSLSLLGDVKDLFEDQFFFLADVFERLNKRLNPLHIFESFKCKNNNFKRTFDVEKEKSNFA